MIDHATLNKISQFASRTHLTADLSHTNHESGANMSHRGENVAVGNYHYDDGSGASILDDQSG